MKHLVLTALAAATCSSAVLAQDGELPPPETSIYFEPDSAELARSAQETLQLLVQRYRSSGKVTFILIGHTDTALPKQESLVLSTRMTNAVASYLLRLGVTEDSITLLAAGEDQAVIPTADGVREPLNRRVEVFVQF